MAAAALACRGAAPAAAPLVPGGVALPFGEPRPFAALYRLACCGQRDLLVTVRADGRTLSVAVASGPAGVVLEAWLTADGGSLRAGGERCRHEVAAGALPLPGSTALPVDPRLAALLLSGTLPREARPEPGAGGWLVAPAGDLASRWRVAEGVVTGSEVREAATRRLLVAVDLDGHHGRVPGRLGYRAGSERGELRLVEWRAAPAPAEPAWLAWRPCGEVR